MNLKCGFFLLFISLGFYLKSIGVIVKSNRITILEEILNSGLSHFITTAVNCTNEGLHRKDVLT